MRSYKNKAILSIAALAAFSPVAINVLAQAPDSSTASMDSWRNKPAADWTEREAHIVLEKSPWAKITVAGIARRQSEDERRAGGNMGQPTGVGFDNVDQRVRPALPTSLFTDSPKVISKAPPIRLLVRWESALPVRVAELKSGEAQPPTLSDEGYEIAVYGVPFTDAKGDPLSLARDFKESAFLKREGKPNVKPLRVEAFELEHSAVVVFLFPYSAEISKKDATVDFVALIGRLQVSQTFSVAEMLYQGKLQL